MAAAQAGTAETAEKAETAEPIFLCRYGFQRRQDGWLANSDRPHSRSMHTR